MDVYASPDILPELQTFLGNFQVRFCRPEARADLERYTTGMLTQMPNKNCDTLARAVPWQQRVTPLAIPDLLGLG